MDFGKSSLKSIVLLCPCEVQHSLLSMTLRIFVSQFGQGDASAVYGYSTVTKNIACQITKNKINK